METLAQKLGLSDSILEAAKKVMKGSKTEVEINPDKELDKPGNEDADVNNDGKVDKTDDYLKNRRKKIKAAMKEAEECPTCVDNVCQCAVEEVEIEEGIVDNIKNAFKKKKDNKPRFAFAGDGPEHKQKNNPFNNPPPKTKMKNPLAKEEIEFSDEEIARINEIAASLEEKK